MLAAGLAWAADMVVSIGTDRRHYQAAKLAGHPVQRARTSFISLCLGGGSVAIGAVLLVLAVATGIVGLTFRRRILAAFLG